MFAVFAFVTVLSSFSIDSLNAQKPQSIAEQQSGSSTSGSNEVNIYSLAGQLARGALNQLFIYANVHISETSQPVTREEALKHLKPSSLPASARDIQYYLMFMQVTPGFTQCVRFEAPVDDCKTLAHDLLGLALLVPVSHPSRPRSSDVPAWFEPNNITKGIMGGKGYDGQPKIWIDEERGIYYFYLTD